MRIAVVLYGQPRTWKVCLPRLLLQLSVLRRKCEIELFCNVKDYNSYANSPVDASFGGRVDRAELELMRDQLRNFDPNTSWSILSKEQDEARGPNQWHYTAMFSSMQLAAIPFFERSVHYDLVLVSRLDVMYDSLEPLLKVEPFSLYVEHASIRYAKESYSLGVQDYYFYGDRLSIQLLVGATFSGTANLTYPVAKNFGFRGPGVYLRNLAVRSNLVLRESQIQLAIVRPSAPITGDFAYHQRYWKQAHSTGQLAPPQGSSKSA